MAGIEDKRNMLDIMRGELKLERSSFIGHWRQLSDYILPRRARFTVTDVNKGERRNLNIIDSTATLADRTLRSGMVAGITSPARPWFRLTTPDGKSAELGPVKEWLGDVAEKMRTVFLRSNLYNVLPLVYGDISVFATGCMMIEEDFDRVVHFRPFPIGSYMLGNDEKGRVRVFYREFRMTVRNIVRDFGGGEEKPDFSNISSYVETLWKNRQFESWVDVHHVIYPNPDFRPDSPMAKHKRYASVHFEAGISAGHGTTGAPLERDKFLRESGFDEFPILAPRWEVSAEDVYGTSCPGMTALGDVKQLQTGEKRLMEAIEKMVRPPMKGPESLRHISTSILPGDISYVTETEKGKFEPVFQVDPRINELSQKQDQIRGLIRRSFFEDLFLMLAQTDRRQITATEIEARQQEKLIALGPVLEQLNSDLLDPLIDQTFSIMLRQGLIPDPPRELEGVDLKVEYISIMAQAQKLIGLAGMERLTNFVGNLAAAKQDPSVWDKMDTDQAIDEYHESVGTPPGIIVPDEEVEDIRRARAERQQAEQAAEQARQASGAAKDLAGAKLEDDSALKRLLNQAEAGALTGR